MNKLKKIYLAIPYTQIDKESSYKQANLAAALILNQEGLNVYSPITHSHPLTQQGLDIPHTWEFWSQIDYQFLDWCDEVWVLVPKEGIVPIKKSVGINAEIKYAKEHNKSVKFIRIIDNQIYDVIIE
jgi:hypothetical protein